MPLFAHKYTHTPVVRWSGGWVGCARAACRHCWRTRSGEGGRGRRYGWTLCAAALGSSVCSAWISPPPGTGHRPLSLTAQHAAQQITTKSRCGYCSPTCTPTIHQTISTSLFLSSCLLIFCSKGLSGRFDFLVNCSLFGELHNQSESNFHRNTQGNISKSKLVGWLYICFLVFPIFLVHTCLSSTYSTGVRMSDGFRERSRIISNLLKQIPHSNRSTAFTTCAHIQTHVCLLVNIRVWVVTDLWVCVCVSLPTSTKYLTEGGSKLLLPV